MFKKHNPNTIEYWKHQSHMLCKALVVSSILGPFAGGIAAYLKLSHNKDRVSKKEDITLNKQEMTSSKPNFNRDNIFHHLP